MQKRTETYETTTNSRIYKVLRRGFIDLCCGYCQWKRRRAEDKDNTRTWKRYRKHQYK